MDLRWRLKLTRRGRKSRRSGSPGRVRDRGCRRTQSVASGGCRDRRSRHNHHARLQVTAIVRPSAANGGGTRVAALADIPERTVRSWFEGQHPPSQLADRLILVADAFADEILAERCADRPSTRIGRVMRARELLQRSPSSVRVAERRSPANSGGGARAADDRATGAGALHPHDRDQMAQVGCTSVDKGVDAGSQLRHGRAAGLSPGLPERAVLLIDRTGLQDAIRRAVDSVALMQRVADEAMTL